MHTYSQPLERLARFTQCRRIFDHLGSEGGRRIRPIMHYFKEVEGVKLREAPEVGKNL